MLIFLGCSIYVTRTTLAAYYNYRIESLSSRLKEQQAERAKTIKKLKEATKYNSTLELLEKYGGADGRPSQSRKDSSAEKDGNKEDADGRHGKPNHGMGRHPNSGMPGRTNLPPPPTANIQRRPLSPLPGPPQAGSETVSPQPQDANPFTSVPVTEEFAPNAYTHTPPPPPQTYARYDAATEPHWYDRVLDLLLGEDEMAAKNRIVLVCQECRLVNGQAPPGTKTLSDMGMWKCMSCGAMNGEVDEEKKIVQEVLDAREKGGSHEINGETPRMDPEAEFEEEEGGYEDEAEPGVVSTGTENPPEKESRARRRKGKK